MVVRWDVTQSMFTSLTLDPTWLETENHVTFSSCCNWLESGSYRYLFSHLPRCWTVWYRSVSASFIHWHVGEYWDLIGHRKPRDSISGRWLVKFCPSHSFSTVPRGDEGWRVSLTGRCLVLKNSELNNNQVAEGFINTISLPVAEPYLLIHVDLLSYIDLLPVSRAAGSVAGEPDLGL